MTRTAYDLLDALPPTGTRVEHELHGPATVIGDHVEFGQWFIRFDVPFDVDGRQVTQAWCYPYYLAPQSA